MIVCQLNCPNGGVKVITHVSNARNSECRNTADGKSLISTKLNCVKECFEFGSEENFNNALTCAIVTQPICQGYSEFWFYPLIVYCPVYRKYMCIVYS